MFRPICSFDSRRAEAAWIATQIAPFVPNKHLSLIEPGLSIDLQQQDDQLVCEVTAGSLARFVEVELGRASHWSTSKRGLKLIRHEAQLLPLPLDRLEGSFVCRAIPSTISSDAKLVSFAVATYSDRHGCGVAVKLR